MLTFYTFPDEDPLSRIQGTSNGIVISHTLSPTSPAFGQSLALQGLTNPPYSGSLGAMAAGFEDGSHTSGMGMDNVQWNRLWDIVAEQSKPFDVDHLWKVMLNRSV